MDIERIRHGFRLRSGRLKRSKKNINEGTQVNGVDLDSQTPNYAADPKASPEYYQVDSRSNSVNQDGRFPVRSTFPSSHPENVLARPNSPSSPPALHKRLMDASSNKNKPLPNPRRFSKRGFSFRGSNRRNEPANTYQQDQIRRSSEDSTSTGEKDYVLHPPPPNATLTTIDGLSDLLYSKEYLQFIIHDPALFARFTAFLNRYRPHLAVVLIQYLETQKAIKAIEYANSVAAHASALPEEETSVARIAASLDSRFQERSETTEELLVSDALPAHITYDLVSTVTEIMAKDISGAHQTPIMRNMVKGLTEVFCLADPSQEDTPIIYASNEFYRETGYGRDFVIGRNCRFLQGPKTVGAAIRRLKQALDTGHEISETVLNYRRDGTPFLNLLMIAPLHDDKGNVRYYIGAQVDVTGLLEDGQGLDGFDRFLRQQAIKAKDEEAGRGRKGANKGKKETLDRLRELSEMFDLEESAIVQSHSRSNSMTRDDEASVASISRSQAGGRSVLRKRFDSARGDEDEDSESRRLSWNLALSKHSGRLPGVYEKFFLLRPSSSLRIIFISPALQKLGNNILQTPFMSHVSASESTLDGLKESFSSGNPVTAKIRWHQNVRPRTKQQRRNSRPISGSEAIPDATDADNPSKPRTCWISATPLLGSDDNIGVWMVIMVDRSHQQVSSSTRSQTSTQQRAVSTNGFNPTWDYQAKSQSNDPRSHDNFPYRNEEDGYVKTAVSAPLKRAERVMINGSPRSPTFPPPPRDVPQFPQDVDPEVQKLREGLGRGSSGLLPNLEERRRENPSSNMPIPHSNSKREQEREERWQYLNGIADAEGGHPMEEEDNDADNAVNLG
ncbi:MAG: hypothetical protein Q9227_007038 [Pyrenula ochraceoflavens]